MARYGYFYRLPSYLGSTYCFKEVSTSPSNPQPPYLHKRSRGRHEPGSDDYVNRYVFADSVPLTGGGVITLRREAMDDEPGIYKEPCKGRCILNSQKWVYSYLSCRISGPQGNKWYGHIDARYFDNSRWYRNQPYRKRCIRDVNLGAYSSMSHAQAWAAFTGFIALYEGASYAEAEHLVGYQGEYIESLFGIHEDTVKVVDDLRFTPQMDLYDLRNTVGDYTVNTRGALAAAYVDACDKLPSLSGMNNVANSIQLVQSLKSALAILVGHDKMSSASNLIEGAKDAWLSYRYVYNTTKADCEEALSYLNRALDLARSNEIRSNGIYHESNWTVRCSLRVKCDALDKQLAGLEKYGMRLTAYNLWDLVPYSFIVDWFADVGGALEACEKANFALNTSPCSVWYSIERDWVNEWGYRELYYYRFSGSRPDLSWVSRGSHGPKMSTWVKRGLDVFAIFG